MAEPPQQASPWYVLLVEPQQEKTTIWRLHELGLEMYSPIVRRRVRRGRAEGVRLAVRAMFPGYGFIKASTISDLNVVRRVRGIRDFHAVMGKPSVLHWAAIEAVRRKEFSEHQRYLDELAPKRKSKVMFRPGDIVRVEVGAFADMVATVETCDTRGRLTVLQGLIRISMDSDMVSLVA